MRTSLDIGFGRDENAPAVRQVVPVLLFAAAAEALGAEQVTLEVGSSSTVDELEQRLRAAPGGDALPRGLRLAVNQRFVAGTHPVRAGDEVAAIPPVAGG